MTHDNFVYRYQKSVLPYFGDLDVKNINYQALENYVTELSATGISGTTIRSYLQIVRRVLMLACRRGLLPAVPEFPSVKIKLKARGWFSPVEYLTLYRTARRLAGVTMEIRKYQDSLGNQHTQYVRRDDRDNKLGTRMCVCLRAKGIPIPLQQCQDRSRRIWLCEGNMRETAPRERSVGKIMCLFPSIPTAGITH
jgi:hypothetical protein